MDFSIFNTLTPDKGSYLRDESGKKYQDLTSGGGLFPLGYDGVSITGDFPPAASEKELDRLSARISSKLQNKYRFIFFQDKSTALSVLSEFLSSRTDAVYCCEPSLLKLFPGSRFYYPWTCESCSLRPDTCGAFCTTRLDQELDFLKIDRTRFTLMASFLRDFPVAQLPDTYAKYLSGKKSLLIFDEADFFQQTGTLFSFENGPFPDLIMGGESWGNGLPFYFLGIGSHLKSDCLISVPVSPQIIRRVEQNLEIASQQDLEHKIVFFSHKLNLLRDCAITGLYSSGLFALLVMDREKQEKVLDKCRNYGLIVAIDHFGRGIRLSPMLTSSEEEIAQGIDILREIFSKI
ncbi:MAG: hypothetical protein PHW04_05065 [Candidatus Wallbacteria bacterium]|nr:hypothetical protein [Candidatus Wallbacteria bacterium]